MSMNVRNVFSITLAGLLLFSASWGTAHAQDVTQNNHLEYVVISPSSSSTGFNAWFRRAMGYNSYDVSYSFYTNLETGYKYFSGGSICFGTDPRWGMDSNNAYNVLEVKLYKKRWGPDEYMGTRVYQKNAGYQTHRWSGVWPGEYFLHLRTVWNTENWVYDREASVYDC